MIATLIFIMKSGPHTAGLHQVIVLIYWVELHVFVPLWLLVIGVSQTLLVVWARFVFASIQEVLYDHEIWVYSTINRQTWVKLGKTMALNRQSTSPWLKPSFHKDLNTTRQSFALINLARTCSLYLQCSWNVTPKCAAPSLQKVINLRNVLNKIFLAKNKFLR